MRDLAIVGAGPAGRALAHRAAHAGLSVILVDPTPTRPWTATLGAWTDDLPGWLPPACIATIGPGVVYTPQRRELSREYAILDTAALQRELSDDAADVLAAAAHEVGGTWVTLTDGRRLDARIVVDARGNTRSPGAPTQTAYGVAVRRRSTDPDDGSMVVMDWRGNTGTFCYRVPLTDEHELLEETCLAGRPATPVDILSGRLMERHSRASESISTEWVDFPLLPQTPGWRRRDGSALRYGARGGLMHPASGYSVADSLRCADLVVDAICTGRDPRTTLWPWRTRAVFGLRAAGLRALLAFEDDHLIRFFDVFFTLPDAAQRTYLSGRDDLSGTVAAMWQVFTGVERPIRVRLLRGVLSGVRNA